MSDSRPITRRMPLEVAVFSGQSALEAQLLGAARVELNAPGSYAVGGLTPEVDELADIRARLNIPVHVMIRPRGAAPAGPDFVYSAQELAQMILSINEFKAAGVMNPLHGDRFVLGALRLVDDGDGDGGAEARQRLDIDETVCRALVETAKPFGCVFHRAFDPLAGRGRGAAAQAADCLASLGFHAVLTAGGPAGTCADEANLDKIDHMAHRLAGRLAIVVGGGLRRHNVARAAARLAVHPAAAVFFHAAALRRAPDGSVSERIDPDELDALLRRLGVAEPA
ncbi:hypothetical protein CDD83_6049 [Cordyceps sp. RAO-2017]|nr:hypothetical protein CDD83_6049 [Cordyceps sp. RAO-2017]